MGDENETSAVLTRILDGLRGAYEDHMKLCQEELEREEEIQRIMDDACDNQDDI